MHKRGKITPFLPYPTLPYLTPLLTPLLKSLFQYHSPNKQQQQAAALGEAAAAAAAAAAEGEWFGGRHSRRKLRLLGLWLSYEKILNYNLVAEIEPHLCRQLFDSLFRIAAELS